MLYTRTRGGALNNHKNKKEGRDIFKNASKCSAKTKNKYTNKITSNNLTSNIQRPTSNSAITLIALIITIIVLLILAGVTLNMVMGENGIIKKAQLAKSKTEEAQQKEENELENLNKQINDKNSNNPGNLEIDDELQKILKEAGMSISMEDILNTPAIIDKIKGLIPEETKDTVKNKTTENGIIQYEDNFGGIIRTNDEYTDNYAWKAFDGKTLTQTYALTAAKPAEFYVEYEFPNEVYALKTKFVITNNSKYNGKRRVVIQGYNEENKIWKNITEELVYSGNYSSLPEERNINLIYDRPYKRFRLQFLSIEDSTGYGAQNSGIITFQLYGKNKK